MILNRPELCCTNNSSVNHDRDEVDKRSDVEGNSWTVSSNPKFGISAPENRDASLMYLFQTKQYLRPLGIK